MSEITRRMNALSSTTSTLAGPSEDGRLTTHHPHVTVPRATSNQTERLDPPPTASPTHQRFLRFESAIPAREDVALTHTTVPLG